MTHPYPNRAGAVLTVWIQVSFFFCPAQSKLLSREGDIRNRLLQKHSQALRRSRIRIHFAKCVSAPIFLKGTKGVFNRVVAL